MTQFRPRLTSDLMSPWVATTRLSLVATMTPQPVPQKRHGALSHFNSLCGALGDEIGRQRRRRHAARQRRHRGGLQLQNLAAVEFWFGHGSSPDSAGAQLASMA